MELGPIVRALLNHKSRFWLISVEVALTLAIVANCINIIRDQRATIDRPTGIDVDAILVVTSEPFAPAFDDESYLRDSYERDLRALRELPGVRAVASAHQIPLSGGGSATGRKPEGEEEARTVNYFVVSPDIVEALGVEIVAGRNLTAADIPAPRSEGDPPPELPETHNVLLTQAAADSYFPDGDALGKRLDTDSGTSVEIVVGIIERMHGSWPQSGLAERVMLMPGEPFDRRRAYYIVRAEPGAVDGLYARLEDALLEADEGRIASVTSLAAIKGEYYRSLSVMNRLLGAVAVLLVVVTSLGIVGLTSFSVAQRRRQIGTRRALGATRWAVLRYFLVESWVVTGVGLAAGVGMTYAVNFLLANAVDSPKIPLPTVAVGVAALWVVGLVAALLPALRVTAVPPVVATRTI